MNKPRLPENLQKLFSWTMYPYWIFLTALLLSLSIALLSEVPMVDLTRYCPMADAFRLGCWENAFHPRIAPLVPCLGGLLSLLTGLHAFPALKLLSSLTFALTVFPLYGIFRRFLEPLPARIGILMAAFGSMSLRYSSSGMRDSTKGFLYILCVYLLLRIFEDRRKLSSYLWLGFSAALLSLTRTECPVYTGMFLMAAMAFELFRGKPVFPWRSLLAVFTALLVMTPWLCYMQKTTGYPVPQVRYAHILDQLLNREDYRRVLIEQNDTGTGSADVQQQAPSRTRTKAPILPALRHNKEYEHSNEPPTLERFFNSILNGFYPPFAILALLGVFVRLKQKKWTVVETIVCAALFLHLILLILQIRIADHTYYVSRRYQLPVTPLEFGWSAYGAWVLYQFLAARTAIVRHPAVVVLLFLVPAVLLYCHGILRIYKSYRSNSKSLEREALRRFSREIRRDYRGPRHFERMTFDLERYTSNLRPTVFSYWEQLGILSGGQSLHADDPDWQLGRITPDYIVVRQNDISPDAMRASGYVRIRTCLIRGIPFHLYKNREI